MFSKELQGALKQYEGKFDDCFPTIPLAEGREEKEVVAMIAECIRENKDVYELGYLVSNDDILY